MKTTNSLVTFYTFNNFAGSTHRKRKHKHTKEDAMLGIFGDDSDNDEYTPGKYAYQQ